MESVDEKVFVYQLRVRLREISPDIWRRILVRSDTGTNQITVMVYTRQF